MLRPSCLTLRTSSSYFQAAQHARQLHRFVMPQGCVGWTTSPAAGAINNLTLPRGYSGGCREAHHHPRRYLARAGAYPPEAPGTSSREATKPITTLPTPRGWDEHAVSHRQNSEAVRPLARCYRGELPQRAKLQCSERL